MTFLAQIDVVDNCQSKLLKQCKNANITNFVYYRKTRLAQYIKYYIITNTARFLLKRRATFGN